MKHCLRILAFLLLAVMILSAAVTTVAAENGKSASASAVSKTIDLFSPLSLTFSSATFHKENQTRLVTVSSGTYYALITNETMIADYGEISLIHKDNDGNLRLLYQNQEIYGVNQSGISPIVMADADENIWVSIVWEPADGPHQAHLWKWDVAKEELTHYEDASKAAGNSGYSHASLNTRTNQIVQTLGGGTVPGYISFRVFDIATETFGPWKIIKTDYRYLSHFMFWDDNNGLYIAAERNIKNYYIPVDTGENCAEAMARLHSRQDVKDTIGDRPVLFYIPDVNEVPEKKYFSNYTMIDLFHEPTFDVEKGYYVRIDVSDAYKDANNILHIIIRANNIAGNAGSNYFLQAYDLNDGGKLLEETKFYPVCNKYAQLMPRYFADTKGNLYLLMEYTTLPADSGNLWIYAATNEYGTEMVLIDKNEFENPCGFQWVANERNNSITSDTGWFIHQEHIGQKTVVSTYSVDFAALREYRNWEGKKS